MAAVPSVAFPFKGSDSNSYSGQTIPVTAAGLVSVDTVAQGAATNRGAVSTVKATGATVTTGGSGYAAGDLITNAAGIFSVTTVSTGGVSAVTALTPNGLTATTTGALAQTATSGAGTGCTLAPIYAAAALQVAPANTGRRGFGIQNQSAAALWFSLIGPATADNNSFLLGPGDYFESAPQHVGAGAISVIGTGAGQPFYAREF